MATLPQSMEPSSISAAAEPAWMSALVVGQGRGLSGNPLPVQGVDPCAHGNPDRSSQDYRRRRYRDAVASVLGFPDTVNEKAARVVAGGVAIVALLALITGWHWLLVPLALGFLARVLAGPKLSPLAQLATRVVAPRLGAPKLVPGPPKRFAQLIGLTFTVVAAAASLWFDRPGVAAGLLGVLIIFATLESVVGFCAGCWMFGQLMRLGVIPEHVCVACGDIWRRA